MKLTIQKKKKKKIDIALKELNEFGIKLKGSLVCEEQNMEEKKQNMLKEKKKIKNQSELDLLSENNDKMEKYLELLGRQYELEIRHIQQYCEHKSKIEKISEKYSHINFKEIVSLENLYHNDLDKITNVTRKTTVNNKQPLEISCQLTEPHKDMHVMKQPQPQIQGKPRVDTIVNNPNMNSNKNDIRKDGSLQSHLRNALNTKYKALKTNEIDEDDKNSDISDMQFNEQKVVAPNKV